MGTEVDHGDIQTNIATPSSTTAAGGPRTSMFAKKSGFVIPKNKLSGSLVPVYRATKKGNADLMKEEATTNQVARKTKWGPDLTLDNTVRKGRALAYQARINQISEQLTLGTMEVEGNQDFLSTSDHQLTKEESELMEMERREIIGEVLKLNPAYKAPADYKPLLKEAKVPIPIKEYPGYNFISLVFGPANDTQKRLEKETGAKIQVYGKKSDNGGKIEIVTLADGKEADNAYEDLYVHVSADTFEKIDEAVALIELLLTPVSVNPVSSSTTQTPVSDTNVNTHQNATISTTEPPPINQTTQPNPRPLLHHQEQLPKYPQPWFNPNPNNTVQVSSSPFNPTPYIRPPVITPSFPPRPQNPLQPLYIQQADFGPRNTPGPPYNLRPIISTPLPGNLPIVPPRAPPPNIPNNMQIQPPPTGPAGPTFFRGSHGFDSARPLPARPQQPSSGDFTFQPHRPWQTTNYNPRPPVQPGPGPPMLRPMMSNLSPNPSSVQTFPRHQMNFSPRPPMFSPGPHMQQPRNFMPQQSGPFHQRPGPQMHFPENQVRPPQMFPSPRQHFGRPISSPPGPPQQVYDPFSPSSVPFDPRVGGSDPEYDDLISKVGVQ